MHSTLLVFAKEAKFLSGGGLAGEFYKYARENGGL